MKNIIFGLVATLLMMGSAYAQSPNERVHVLQKRNYSVKNKTEVSFFGGLSVDDTFTQHYAGTITVDYHLDEAFAIEAMWMTSKIPFVNGDKQGDGYTGDGIRWGMGYTDALENLRSAQLSPSNADLAMIGNFVGLNVQFSPIYGKFSFFNMGLIHTDFYVTAGGGLASTEYQRPDDVWVDTGVYFMGDFCLGLRIFLERWFALRLDVRDFVFAARVENATQTGFDTKIRSTLYVMFGVSLLFGGEDPVQIWSPY